MTEAAVRTRPLRSLQAVALGGAVVGTLDILDAMIFYGLYSGATPVRIFQSIARGYFGQASFQGGWRTALIGLATHYFIATSIVAFYLGASRVVPALRRWPIPCGIMYGICVFYFMYAVVMPLSAIGARPPLGISANVINGLAIHAFGIGLPSALIAARVPAGGEAPPVAVSPASRR